MAEKPTYEELEQIVRKLEMEAVKHKQAKEADSTSAERFRVFFRSINDAIFVHPLQEEGFAPFIEVNDIACSRYGYSHEEFLQLAAPDITKKPDANAHGKRSHRSKLLEKGNLVFESVHIKKSGEHFPVEINSSIIDQSGKPFILAVVRDITERKLAEEALRQSEDKYRQLFEMESDALFLVRKSDGQILEVNTAGLKLYGFKREELLKMKNSDLSAEPDDTQKATMEKRRKIPLRYHRKKDGTVFPVEITASHFTWQDQAVHIAAIRDITRRIEAEKEKVNLEEKLQHIHKMEAIGTLAGGIAHQFNNALSGIVGNIEMLMWDSPAGEDIRRYVDPMKNSAQRMINLTNQLLAYARGGKYQEESMLLSAFIKDTLPLIEHSISSTIHVETDLPMDVFPIKADLTQMQMVLTAVLNNASEAMDGGRGRIRISTGNKEVDVELSKNHPGLKPGTYVCLTIEDNGKGMDEATKSHVFDPFFTTKFHGRGLGMAAAYGIVKNHDGWILVDSELGVGTAVRIYLPAFALEKIETKKEKIALLKGTGTILVVDDEQIVMDVNKTMLERLGYRVLEAMTGKKAVAIAKNFDGDIDLALLDIVLPDTGGKDVYLQLMKTRPNLKVIVCSGYSIDGPAQEILDAGAQDFIQKPFTLSILSEKLNRLLGGQ